MDVLLLEVLSLIPSGVKVSDIKLSQADLLFDSGFINLNKEYIKCDTIVSNILRKKLFRAIGDNCTVFSAAYDILRSNTSWVDGVYLDSRRFDLAFLSTLSGRIEHLDIPGFPTHSYLKWKATLLSRENKYSEAAKIYSIVLNIPGMSRDAYSNEYYAYNKLESGEMTFLEALPFYEIAATEKRAAILYRKRFVDALVRVGDPRKDREIQLLIKDFRSNEQLYLFAIPEIAETMCSVGNINEARIMISHIPSYISGDRIARALLAIEMTVSVPDNAEREDRVIEIRQGEVMEIDDRHAYVQWDFPDSLKDEVGELSISCFPEGMKPYRGAKIEVVVSQEVGEGKDRVQRIRYKRVEREIK